MRAATIERVETPRTVCERMRMSDVPELLGLLRDPRVAETLWPEIGIPTEQDVIDGTADKERHWERHGFGLWVQRDRDTGELVGRGGLQWTHVAGEDEVEAGWAVVPERWGRGLATELAQASVETAFGALGLRDIVAFALPDNVASRRVMQKTGFAFDQEIVYAGLPHVLYRLPAPPG
jgi:[ribosomal protein S5]-alanine N-acetyltransferase